LFFRRNRNILIVVKFEQSFSLTCDSSLIDFFLDFALFRLLLGRRLEEHLCNLMILISKNLVGSKGSFLHVFVLKLFVADIKG